MGNTISADKQFLNCLGVPNKGSRKIEFQFNRPWDIEKNIWYKINEDFLIVEWAGEMEYSSTDVNNSGDPRTKTQTESFKETISFTFKDAYNKSFYHEIVNISNQGDEYWLNFINGGINIRITIDYGMGATEQVTFNCCSPMPNSRPFMYMASLESGFEMPCTINFEATSIVRTGAVDKLPAGIVDLTATVTPVVTAAEIATTISTILDPTGLLLRDSTDSFKIDVMNVTTGEMLPSVFGGKDVAIKVTVPAIGEYKIYSYYLIDEMMTTGDTPTAIKEYRLFDEKMVEVTTLTKAPIGGGK